MPEAYSHCGPGLGRWNQVQKEATPQLPTWANQNPTPKDSPTNSQCSSTICGPNNQIHESGIDWVFTSQSWKPLSFVNFPAYPWEVPPFKVLGLLLLPCKHSCSRSLCDSSWRVLQSLQYYLFCFVGFSLSVSVSRCLCYSVTVCVCLIFCVIVAYGQGALMFLKEADRDWQPVSFFISLHPAIWDKLSHRTWSLSILLD